MAERKCIWVFEDQHAEWLDTNSYDLSSGGLERIAEIDGELVVLLPGEYFNSLYLDIPTKNLRKAETAAWFVLSEISLEKSEQMQMMLSNQNTPARKWACLLVNSQWLGDWLKQLAELARIRPLRVMPDYLGLPLHPDGWTVVVSGDKLLVRFDQHSGFSSEQDLAVEILKSSLRVAPEQDSAFLEIEQIEQVSNLDDAQNSAQENEQINHHTLYCYDLDPHSDVIMRLQSEFADLNAQGKLQVVQQVQSQSISKRSKGSKGRKETDYTHSAQFTSQNAWILYLMRRELAGKFTSGFDCAKNSNLFKQSVRSDLFSAVSWRPWAAALIAIYFALGLSSVYHLYANYVIDNEATVVRTQAQLLFSDLLGENVPIVKFREQLAAQLTKHAQHEDKDVLWLLERLDGHLRKVSTPAHKLIWRDNSLQLEFITNDQQLAEQLTDGFSQQQIEQFRLQATNRLEQDQWVVEITFTQEEGEG